MILRMLKNHVKNQRIKHSLGFFSVALKGPLGMSLEGGDIGNECTITLNYPEV